MKELIKGWLEKGVNIVSIPTRPKPQQIEHNIREEFERARVIRVLNHTLEFLRNIDCCGWSEESSQLKSLTVEITALIKDLEAYKK